MLENLEKHGGICDSQASRDTFIYAASAYTKGLDDVMKLLGEVVLRPQITPDELDMARQTIGFELESLAMRPEQETLLTDMIHAVSKVLNINSSWYDILSIFQAAYRDNTLGLPKLCPEGNISKIDRNILFTYLSQHYTPKRMVVAGVGVEHQKLVEATQKYFVDLKSAWEMDPALANKSKQISIDNSIAQYTGGFVQVCL